MDCCLPYNKASALYSLPLAVKILRCSSISSPRFPLESAHKLTGEIRSLASLISLGSGTRRRSARCEFSSLNAPLEPRSQEGRFLSGVLQNDRGSFHTAVAEQLERLVVDRDAAVSRMKLSLGSDEAWLHRRISGLRKRENRIAVEEIMYVLVFYKFLDIRVHLVPSLSKCIYNGRLEVSPSKDWELESIHSYEVLEIIREHLTTVIGWKANSSVLENWAATKIHRHCLRCAYATSVLHGYFLKSATLRHHLELNLERQNNTNNLINTSTHDHIRLLELWSRDTRNAISGDNSGSRTMPVSQVSYNQGTKGEKLKYYVMGLDSETIQMCGKPKSKEAVNLIERHISALFGDETEDVISTSLASLKRLVLEAIAFGSFLWDSEDYVNTVYKLEDN